MVVIDINGSVAKEQATNICKANDKLTISQAVTFSSSTTVPGNQTAESSFESLRKAAPTIQQLLNRDVENIHSAVAAFERTDIAAATALENLLNT